MSTFMQAEPLDAEPYMRVIELDRDQRVVEELEVSPPLAAVPRRVRFSPDKQHMIAVSDLRVQYEESIGGVSDDSPVGGIRVFSGDDQWLLMGGVGGSGARLYQRSGPGYRAYTKAFTGGGPLANFYAADMAFAVFNDDASLLFVVPASDLSRSIVYRRSGATWQYVKTTAGWPGHSINFLRFEPVGEFFIEQAAFGSVPDEALRLHKVTGANTVVVPPTDYYHDGRLLTVSPDGAHWLFAPGNSAGNELRVCKWVAGVLTGFVNLPRTTGTNRDAFYLPDGRMLVVTGAQSAGHEMPVWFDVQGDTYVLTGGVGLTGSGETFAGVASRASDKIMVRSPTTLRVLERGPWSGQDFADAADPLSIGSTNLSNPMPLAVSRDGRYVFLQTNAAWHRKFWNGSAFVDTTHVAVPAMPGLQSNAKLAISPDGEYYAVGGNSNDNRYLTIMRRDPGSDTAYTRVPDAQLPPVADCPRNVSGAAQAFEFSPDGQHLIVLTTLAPYLFIYKVSGGVWSRVTTHPGLTAAAYAVKFSPSGEHVLFGRPFRMMKRVGDTYAYTPVPDITTANVVDVSWANDGLKIGVSDGTGVFFYRKVADDLFRLDVVPDQTPYSGTRFIVWTDDSKIALIGRFPTARRLKAFRFDGDDYAEEDISYLTDTTAGLCGLAVQPGTGRVMAFPAATSPSRYYQYAPLEGLLTFTQAHLETSGGGLYANGTFSPSGAVLHVDKGSTGVHLDTLTFLPVEEVAFALGVAPSAVRQVLFSPLGAAALYVNGTKNGAAVRPPNGDFINVHDLRGTFVALYDRVGLKFKERGYATHPVAARITDIQFSKNSMSFCYHVQPNGPYLPDQVTGRAVYDIRAAGFELAGVAFRVGDQRSLFAYSPWEGHFVNVAMNEDGSTAIRLYRIDAAAPPDVFTFTQTDMEEVYYGPPAFSNCDTVVVAHGGPIPFTMYARVVDELVFRPIEINDWEEDDFVLGVAFTPDCAGLIIVTPDKVISVGDDGDDSWTPKDEFPTKDSPSDGEPDDSDDTDNDPDDWNTTPDDDQKNVDVDDDGTTTVQDPDITKDPEKPTIVGDTDLGDKTIDDITTPGYVAVNITYRTW